MHKRNSKYSLLLKSTQLLWLSVYNWVETVRNNQSTFTLFVTSLCWYHNMHCVLISWSLAFLNNGNQYLFSVKLSSRLFTEPGFTANYQQIPEETRLLARGKGRLRRRWQRARHPADKAAYNRATKILRRHRIYDLRCWELGVAREMVTSVEIVRRGYWLC